MASLCSLNRPAPVFLLHSTSASHAPAPVCSLLMGWCIPFTDIATLSAHLTLIPLYKMCCVSFISAIQSFDSFSTKCTFFTLFFTQLRAPHCRWDQLIIIVSICLSLRFFLGLTSVWYSNLLGSAEAKRTLYNLYYLKQKYFFCVRIRNSADLCRASALLQRHTYRRHFLQSIICNSFFIFWHWLSSKWTIARVGQIKELKVQLQATVDNGKPSQSQTLKVVLSRFELYIMEKWLIQSTVLCRLLLKVSQTKCFLSLTVNTVFFSFFEHSLFLWLSPLHILPLSTLKIIKP